MWVSKRRVIISKTPPKNTRFRLPNARFGHRFRRSWSWKRPPNRRRAVDCGRLSHAEVGSVAHVGSVAPLNSPHFIQQRFCLSLDLLAHILRLDHPGTQPHHLTSAGSWRSRVFSCPSLEIFQWCYRSRPWVVESSWVVSVLRSWSPPAAQVVLDQHGCVLK